MPSPLELLRTVVASERAKHLAGFAGFAVVAGLASGIEVGLLESDTALGLVTGVWLGPYTAGAVVATCQEWRRALDS